MPLRPLADEILRLSERYNSTPVLVTPSYLSLRHRFFLELVGTLFDKTHRSIRIDWYRGMPSLFSLVGDRIACLHAVRMNRALASLASQRGTTASFQITGMIARPKGGDSELSVGFCNQRLTLPKWATPIRLGASPTQMRQTQLSH